MGKIYNYILVNGYYASGASAVVDYLKEFSGVFTPDSEFRLIKEAHGIMDLDYVLNGHFDVLNEDIAIKEFLGFMDKYSRDRRWFRYGLNHQKHFGENLMTLSEKYIEELINCKYKGYWWQLDINTPYWKHLFQRIVRKLKIYDYRKHSDMYYRNNNEGQFLDATRNYLDAIFKDLLKNREDIDRIILEQVIPANQSDLSQRYFPGSKVIVVERDPRDVFIESAELGVPYGQITPYAVQTGNIELFIDYFKKMRMNTNNDHTSYNIRFEDLIFNNNNCQKALLEYVGIREEQHIVKEKYFIPERSKNNIGIWKRNLKYEKEMKIIEDELKEYLYEN